MKIALEQRRQNKIKQEHTNIYIVQSMWPMSTDR